MSHGSNVVNSDIFQFFNSPNSPSNGSRNPSFSKFYKNHIHVFLFRPTFLFKTHISLSSPLTHSPGRRECVNFSSLYSKKEIFKLQFSRLILEKCIFSPVFVLFVFYNLLTNNLINICNVCINSILRTAI